MNRALALTVLGSLCATLVGCGGSPPSPPAASPRPVAAAAATPAAAAAKPPAPAQSAPPAPSASPAQPAPPAPLAQPAPLVPLPPIPDGGAPAYEAKGRRDPFVALDITGGPKGLQVSTTKLTGIVRSAKTTLALVETQDGIGYILKPGDTLGDGRLVEIAVDSVIFAVPPKPGAPNNRVVLKLAAN